MTKKRGERYENIVIDSTVSIASAFNPNGAAAAAIKKALENCTSVQSPEILAELKRKLETPEFSRHASEEERTKVFQKTQAESTIVPLTQKVEVCRDPNDNMFISLALSSGAKQILTYDKDLLSLGQYQGISMRSPAQFLERERELDQRRAVLLTQSLEHKQGDRETYLQRQQRLAQERGEAEIKLTIEQSRKLKP